MLVNDKDALRRLNSPMNLINRLREPSNSRKSAMSLFIPDPREDKKEEIVKKIESIQPSFNPFQSQPQASQLESPSLILPEPQAILENPETTLDTILENHEAQIKLGLAHDKALELLNSSVSMLASKLDDIKADRLPQVVTSASKVVESIRRERNEQSKNNKDREVHYHFYTPIQKKISEYEIIDVAGV